MANSDVLARLFQNAPDSTREQWLDWWVEHGWSREITWRAIEGAPDDVGLIQGTERLRRYYLEWFELFEDIQSEPSGFIDIGDRVVVHIRVSARARSTGMPLALDYSVVYTLDDDGRILAGREYATAAEAIDAARAAAAQHAPAGQS